MWRRLDTPWMRHALAAQLRLGAWVRIQKAKQATNLNIHMGGLTSVVVLPEEWGWLCWVPLPGCGCVGC